MNHREIIRKWIQRNASNGDTVTWGSDDRITLRGVSARDLEELAERIYKAGLERAIEIAHRVGENEHENASSTHERAVAVGAFLVKHEIEEELK